MSAIGAVLATAGAILQQALGALAAALCALVSSSRASTSSPTRGGFEPGTSRSPTLRRSCEGGPRSECRSWPRSFGSLAKTLNGSSEPPLRKDSSGGGSKARIGSLRTRIPSDPRKGADDVPRFHRGGYPSEPGPGRARRRRSEGQSILEGRGHGPAPPDRQIPRRHGGGTHPGDRRRDPRGDVGRPTLRDAGAGDGGIPEPLANERDLGGRRGCGASREDRRGLGERSRIARLPSGASVLDSPRDVGAGQGISRPRTRAQGSRDRCNGLVWYLYGRRRPPEEVRPLSAGRALHDRRERGPPWMRRDAGWRIPLSRGVLEFPRGGRHPDSLFLGGEEPQLVPLDRMLQPVLLEDPAQGLCDPRHFEDLASPVQVELDLVRDREDHPHGAFAVVALGLPVVSEVPEVLLDQHVEALRVFRELLRLLEELQEQRPEGVDQVLPGDLLVVPDVPAPCAHLRSDEASAI